MTVAYSLFECVSSLESNIFPRWHIDHLPCILSCYRTHLPCCPVPHRECTEPSQRHTFVFRKCPPNTVKNGGSGIACGSLADSQSFRHHLAQFRLVYHARHLDIYLRHSCAMSLSMLKLPKSKTATNNMPCVHSLQRVLAKSGKRVNHKFALTFLRAPELGSEKMMHDAACSKVTTRTLACKKVKLTDRISQTPYKQ